MRPAAAAVRANLDSLRQVERRHEPEEITSAEDLIDAAEAYATRVPNPGPRTTHLKVTRVLLRIDQVIFKFATDLGHASGRPAFAGVATRGLSRSHG